RIGFEQRQPAPGLAEEVRAGDDLLARIAALLHAVGAQARERKLLRRPLLRLRRGQPGQAVGEVERGPAVAGAAVLAGRETRPGEQRARAAVAAQVEREAVRRDRRARAACGRVRFERA